MARLGSGDSSPIAFPPPPRPSTSIMPASTFGRWRVTFIQTSGRARLNGSNHCCIDCATTWTIGSSKRSKSYCRQTRRRARLPTQSSSGKSSTSATTETISSMRALPPAERPLAAEPWNQPVANFRIVLNVEASSGHAKACAIFSPSMSPSKIIHSSIFGTDIAEDRRCARVTRACGVGASHSGRRRP